LNKPEVVGWSKAASRQTLPPQSMTILAVLERWEYGGAFFFNLFIQLDSLCPTPLCRVGGMLRYNNRTPEWEMSKAQ
jgi:hypothetical protein